ncbi:MAG: SGNH/GDSL hydrolase family protein [Deltaproteobacteria bacterium]|nr:SGNH/GDSL hydrolase family protein [Deltaproteobacteria bacterium]
MKGSLLLSATLGAAVGCSAPGASPVGPGGDADAGPIDLATLGARALDSLSPAEARAFCLEDAARADPCLDVGLSRSAPEACAERAAECRREAAYAPVAAACDRFYPGVAGSCSVTVESYFACVDAWAAINTCENVGRMLERPEPCREAVAACPRLEMRFFRDGLPPPCEPETAKRPPRVEEDIYGFDGCRPLPSRFVVLGDSIADCFSVQPEECGPYLIREELRQARSPELTYENHAVSGSLLSDVARQATEVAGGPGHVLVWIHSIGNDLILRLVDDAAWDAAFAKVFGHFTDPARFPDGATFLLNTQYSPFDQCPDAPGGRGSISAEADLLLQDINRRVFIERAEARADTVTIDQYPDWLGHGRFADIRGCPHCGSDNTSWMSNDGTHPGPLGYAHMAEKWKVALDRMYAAGCE